MYQREALWVSFSNASSSRAAVKVSVGGVDALTGKPQGAVSKPDEQDYLPVNTVNGQMYVSAARRCIFCGLTLNRGSWLVCFHCNVGRALLSQVGWGLHCSWCRPA